MMCKNGSCRNEATTVWIHLEPVCQNCHNALVNHVLLLTAKTRLPTVEEFQESFKENSS